jgi:uncharacterized protein (TIGR02145 family)
MKKLFYLAIIPALMLTACAKKGNDSDPAGIVTINGTKYPTVVIGSQTWTAVNYNGPGGVNYNNSQVNDPVYGKLYSYVEAEAIPLPNGWHLPAQSDFATLLLTMGATAGNGIYSLPDSSSIKLFAKTTWTKVNGTDATGFNAVAAGFFSTASFSNLGYVNK